VSRVRPSGVVLLAVLLTGTACGSGPNLVPRTTTGTTGLATVVLTDGTTRAAVLAGITDYVRARSGRIVSAVGTPNAVAGSVKQGAVVDAVVLPAGPALDRVRDELVTAPSRLGRVRGTVYYAAPVTSKGALFVQYLLTARGRAQLTAHGVIP